VEERRGVNGGKKRKEYFTAESAEDAENNNSKFKRQT
jgi:hypothetical protein